MLGLKELEVAEVSSFKLVESVSNSLVVIRTQSTSLGKSLSLINLAIYSALAWTGHSWSRFFAELVLSK